MQYSLQTLGIGFFIFVVAGMIKGVLGMGLPTFAIGMLSLIIAPVESAGMLVIPSLLTNIWQLYSGPNFSGLAKRFWTLLLGICLGTPLGVLLLTTGAAHTANIFLGCVLAFYGLFGLTNAKIVVKTASEKWASPLAGFLTGAVMGGTGISVMPAVPYFAALGLKKDDLIQVLGLSFTVSSFALAVGLLLTGQFQISIAGSSLFALIPAFAGMYLGQAIRDKISQHLFKQCFLLGLVLLGSYMAVSTALQN